jgi:hypothetical protein
LPETEGGTVNRQTFQVSYESAPESPGANAHSMNVESLGPALVAFGRLIREANAQINGKKSTVNVLVKSDFEHKCFNITFDMVQTVLHRIATLITGDEVKNAKEILEDLGIILGAQGLGLFGYLKWKGQQTVADVRDSDEKGIVMVQLGNGNVANVSRDAVELAKNPKIRSAAESTLKPIGVDGIEAIKFVGDGGAATYDRHDATTIVASFDIADDLPITETIDDGGNVIAWLRVYSPVYDNKAPKWRFIYEGKSIFADISETTIAADAIRRGGALVNDLYKVRMTVHPHTTPGGQESFDYKIIEVVDFRPANPQFPLPFGDDPES